MSKLFLHLLLAIVKKKEEEKTIQQDQRKIVSRETSSRRLSLEDHKTNTSTEWEYRKRILERVTNKDNVKKDNTNIKRRLVPALKLNEASVDFEENCFLCKLPIYNQELYYRCFTCGAIFHNIHLTDWLDFSDDCPLCNETLMLSSPIEEKG